MTPEVPQPRSEPFAHTEHGVRRPDPFVWMTDPNRAQFLDHLRAERAWYDVATTHLRDLSEQFRTAMESRLPAVDRVPFESRVEYSYYTARPFGADHGRLIRSRNSAESVVDDGVAPVADAQTVLDVEELSRGSAHTEIGIREISPDEKWLAWSKDSVGDEVYRLRFRDLERGEDLEESIDRTYYSGAWSSDSAQFFYTVPDEAYRPHQVWRHRLGTPATQDELVLSEPDQRFELTVRASRSGEWIVIESESNTTSECWVLDAAGTDSRARSVGGRRPGVKYWLEHRRAEGHRSEDLVILTDDAAQEGRLMVAPVPGPEGQDHLAWTEVRAEHPGEWVEEVDVFAGGVVLSIRQDWEHRLRILPHSDLGAEGIVIRPGHPCGAVQLASTPLYDSPTVRVADTAFLHPTVWSDVDLASGERREVWRAESPGFAPDDYVTERGFATSADGTQVPFTLMRHVDTPLDGSAPALLYGYGAYGAVFEAEWDPCLPALLDHGVVYVHTHIRGGGEGGRGWYLDGKLGHKQHTFDDHIAVADHLSAAGLVDGTRIATRGLSAGGLLQGAVFSQRPDRWRAVVAEVPFVDVVTTMLDEATPLTAAEWEEWGDPRIPEELDAMLQWSPYDRLPPAGGRPDLLVTGALHDSRVMIREPAKWVAALRASDPEWGPRLLFRAEVDEGAHAGPAGQMTRLAYEAEIYAWVVDALGTGPSSAR